MSYSKKYILSLLARSLHRFGVFSGLRIASQLLFKRGIFAVSLPGFAYPVFVRGGTSDVETFEKVFIREEYKHDPVDAKFIIDLGSNVGYSVLFFNNMYPDAVIYCVEPEVSNFEILEKNTENFKNIVLRNAAIWSTETQLVIADNEAEKWATQVKPLHPEDIVLFPSVETNIVEAVTIPTILAETNQKRIDILKIDIESAEKELFQSGTEPWLGSVQMLITELHDRILSGCSMTFYRAVSQYDFDQYINGENIFLLRTARLMKDLPLSCLK